MVLNLCPDLTLSVKMIRIGCKRFFDMKKKPFKHVYQRHEISTIFEITGWVNNRFVRLCLLFKINEYCPIV